MSATALKRPRHHQLRLSAEKTVKGYIIPRRNSEFFEAFYQAASAYHESRWAELLIKIRNNGAVLLKLDTEKGVEYCFGYGTTSLFANQTVGQKAAILDSKSKNHSLNIN